MRSYFACGAALVALALHPSSVSAQQDAALEDGSIVGSTFAVDPLWVPTPEGFTLELRIGGYQPSFGGQFDEVFGGDLGPMIGAELDVHVWRVPYLGPLAVGVSAAWAEWDGPGRVVGTGEQSGRTGLSLINFNALLVWRIDGLARYVDVPIILTGKVGPDFGYWESGEGSTTGTGFSFGIRWAAQIALELDFLEPRAARRLDDEWGINHTEIFFEAFGSTMGEHMTQLELGTSFAWAVGLGFTF
ncbi:MXAN_2562 family outer membrane beta-barrel protein [Sandaracinus amylolyticus]|uniref:MXAN_2562 family outer membrane beta-barrel protein n=1 Tax=Sandaracinus amylolyticus TaxID=927083 RepID=UPI001F1A3BC5|nr:MXAN_2562 family outer membrane beta-barrel protein [Sandaracinus amylolyticus]UJR80302.1 Hypothetical protein I5071_23460 [Sandaracinus amylolyticus]